MRTRPDGDASDRFTLALLLVIGVIGAAAVTIAWFVAPGPVPLVAALVASVTATAVAVHRSARHPHGRAATSPEHDRVDQRRSPGSDPGETPMSTPSPVPAPAPESAPAPAPESALPPTPAPVDGAATPVEPTPVEPTPVEPTPVEPTPVEPTPDAAEPSPAADERVDAPAPWWISSPAVPVDATPVAAPVDAPDAATAAAADPTADGDTGPDEPDDAGDRPAHGGSDNVAIDEVAIHDAPDEVATVEVASDHRLDAATLAPSSPPPTTSPAPRAATASRPFLSVDPTPGTPLDPADLGLVTTALSEDGAASVAPYVPRDLDVTLDDALGAQLLAASGGFVVVQGPSASGLTRTMIEALRRHAGRRPVVAVCPPSPDLDRPLAALSAAIRDGDLTDLQRPVVFIDDAHRHLGRGLDRDLLVDLSETLPGCAIVLTISSVRLSMPAIVSDATEAWLRSHGDPLTLPDRFSDTELARAFERFPARSLDGRLRWLPAWCSGADERRGRFRDVRVTDPPQAAVLRAAAAWMLATDDPAVTEPLLVRLSRAAAGDDGIDLRPALDLATATGMLLRIDSAHGATYAVRRELIDEVAAELGRIDDALWAAMLEEVPPSRAALLGRFAAGAGRDEVAVGALTIAVDDPVSAPRAAFELGVVLERLERLEPAAEAYRRTLTSEDPLHAPMAAFHLGGVLEALGRTDAAADAYRWAIDSGHRDAAPLAAFNLGWLHEQQRQPDDAAAAYELAVASEHPDAVPMAAFNLGWLRQQQRRNREAEALYRTAAGSGHDDVAPMAALHLGMLLERLQRTREARALFETVAASDHTEAASAARLRLQTTRRAVPGRRR